LIEAIRHKLPGNKPFAASLAGRAYRPEPLASKPMKSQCAMSKAGLLQNAIGRLKDSSHVADDRQVIFQ
jgi:hypothetical protein